MLCFKVYQNNYKPRRRTFEIPFNDKLVWKWLCEDDEYCEFERDGLPFHFKDLQNILFASTATTLVKIIKKTNTIESSIVNNDTKVDSSVEKSLREELQKALSIVTEQEQRIIDLENQLNSVRNSLATTNVTEGTSSVETVLDTPGLDNSQDESYCQETSTCLESSNVKNNEIVTESMCNECDDFVVITNKSKVLYNMGFKNEDENLKVLLKHGGNVQAAIKEVMMSSIGGT